MLGHALNITRLIVGRRDERATAVSHPIPVTNTTLGPIQATSRYSTGIDSFATM
jgi:hypothetical protein